MRKILLVVLLVSMVCGCGTYGTFSSLEEGKTSKSQVVVMMGEPAATQFVESGEVWRYQFVRQEGKYDVIMDLGVTFRGDVVKNYHIETSKTVRLKASVPNPAIVRSERNTSVRTADVPDFIKKLDKNRDGKVSSSEFPGDKHIFRNWDKNRDGFVDVKEAADVPPPPSGRGRPR